MFEVHVHRVAQKSLNKAPEHIQQKATRLVAHLIQHGTTNAPFRIKALHGPFRKHKFLEAIINKDYRIIFRRENDVFLIRLAGTHNELHAG